MDTASAGDDREAKNAMVWDVFAADALWLIGRVHLLFFTDDAFARSGCIAFLLRYTFFSAAFVAS